MSPLINKAIGASFEFALRNGSARLSIGGREVTALLVDTSETAGDTRAGRNRATKTQTVGVLKGNLPAEPPPDTLAILEGWACEVESVEGEAHAWVITLRSPS